MPPKKNEAEAPKESTALTVDEKKALAAIKMAGGSDQGGSNLNVPLLKLEHTTNFEGETNPLKGQFTLTRRTPLGEWQTTELGDMITCQFILQRYYLTMTKDGGKIKYSTKEFDNPNERVLLFKSEGKGDDRKVTPYAENTPNELAKDFLRKETVGGKERVTSDLKLLYVLYLKLEGSDEIVKWKTNVSAAMAYRKYQNSGVIPFAVITKVTREEAKAGSNKYYRPSMKAVKPLEDFNKVLAEQTSLRETLTVGNAGNTIQIEEEE